MELIKIEKHNVGDDYIDTVNARHLWNFIESGQDFSHWITGRIEKYGFVNGGDFTIILSKSNGGRPSKEYHVSTDMAKELSMVERNAKGKQARQYFIDCEKKYKAQHLNRAVSVPKTYKEALIALVSEIEHKEKAQIELKEAQPKIEFHDQVGDSEGLYSIGEVAKMLNLDFGRNIMFQTLRDLDIFFKREPYQKYIKQGYFEVKSTTNNGHVQKQAFATAKGFQWLQKKHFSKPYQTEF